jgi:hypothetical protein
MQIFDLDAREGGGATAWLLRILCVKNIKKEGKEHNLKTKKTSANRKLVDGKLYSVSTTISHVSNDTVECFKYISHVKQGSCGLRLCVCHQCAMQRDERLLAIR